MKIQHHEPYGPLRRIKYPDTGDQLDAIAALAQMLRDQEGFVLPEKTARWLAEVEAVKARYPKKT